MCGIIAHVGGSGTVDKLIDGLSNLEYRGYDSAGVAVQDDSGLTIHKRAGEISDIKREFETMLPSADVGIGHTRWSTHGPPTDANAHPQSSESETVAVVHNGIIENYQELRRRLRDRGHEFTSETDTEVIPHLIEEYDDDGTEPAAAFRRAVDQLEGSYAIAAMVEGENRVFATRSGSPLILGLGEDEHYLASDIPAFLDRTREVVYLKDGDVVILDADDVRIQDTSGESVTRSSDTVDWDAEETGKGAFDHYMLKEIHTQPNALSNTIRGRMAPDEGRVELDDVDASLLEGVEDVHLVACGTSYHAALYGAKLMNEAGVRARAFRASEYAETASSISEETLVVAVTQSGETADTLSALRVALTCGAQTLTVTNVVGSTAAREADDTVFIRAGPEIGVAATKTFTSQAVTLVLLSQRLARELPQASCRDDLPALLDAVRRIPSDVEHVIENSAAADLGTELLGYDAYFFIGRAQSFPVALEGALKFKEITYEHAEGFSSGQLKHGPLALVTPNTPVFALFTGETTDKTVTNAKEAQTRGADIIGVGPERSRPTDVADEYLSVPDTHPVCQNLLANVQFQLVSYHTAKSLGRSIDKPRNLAKSVTVQ